VASLTPPESGAAGRSTATPGAAARGPTYALFRGHRLGPISFRHLRFSLHFHGSAFEAEGLAVNQSIRHFTAGLLDDPGEGRPRNLHLPGRLFLVEPIQVGQA
jgi:hypothetical protein